MPADMKPINLKSKHLFRGTWKIVSLYCNVQGQGWTLFKKYGRNSFIWTFTQKDYRLIEQRKGEDATLTEYSYFPSDKQLYIDRSDYEPDGFCNICINDRYRVEKINDSELWLYDLEDVENEPEDYRFKMKIRRLLDK